MKKNRYIYYVYVVILILILWSVIQLARLGKQTTIQEKGSANPAVDDTLIVFVSGIPDRIDPYSAFFDVDWFIYNQIFRGLTKINYDLTVSPDQCRYWTISPDKTVYTFFWNDSLFFHDGSRATIDDFIYSVRYFLKNYSKTYTVNYFRVIQGVDEFLAGKSTTISGIRKTAPDQLEIRLNHPYVPFLTLLSMPEVRILPARLLKKLGKKFFRLPIGTGPYQLTETGRNFLLLKSFEKNKIYQSAVRYYKIIGYNESNEDELSDLFDQKLDICTFPVDTFLENPVFLKKEITSSFNLVFLGFNCALPPTDNTWVRKTLFYGAELDSLRKFYGEIAVTSEFISPILLPKTTPQRPVVKSNFAKAQDIVQNLRMGGKENWQVPIKVLVDTLTYSNQFGTVFQGLRDSLGLNIKYHLTDNSDSPEYLRKIKEMNVFVFDWQLDIPDPDFFFRLLFHSRSPMNLFNYHNPQVDSLLDLARFEPNNSRRLRLFSQVENIIYRDTPLRPLFYLQDYIFYKDYLHGVFLSRFGLPSLDLTKITMDRKLFEKHNWRRE